MQRIVFCFRAAGESDEWLAPVTVAPGIRLCTVTGYAHAFAIAWSCWVIARKLEGLDIPGDYEVTSDPTPVELDRQRWPELKPVVIDPAT